MGKVIESVFFFDAEEYTQHVRKNSNNKNYSIEEDKQLLQTSHENLKKLNFKGKDKLSCIKSIFCKKNKSQEEYLSSS